MKKLAVMGFLGWGIAFLVFCSLSFASENAKFYLEGEVGASFMNLDSGGFNPLGPHNNTGDDWDATVVPGVHAGIKLFNVARVDLGFNYRGGLDFTTNSYPGFSYKTEVEDIFTVMLSAYAEPFHFGKWTPYIGAGVGGAWIDTNTNDGVVMGSTDETNFAWQAETGMQYELTQHITLRLGYRYIDMGTFKTPMYALSDGDSGGDFEGDLAAHEVIAGVRYCF